MGRGFDCPDGWEGERNMKRFTALVLMFAAFIPCMADERAKPVVLAQEWHNGDSESVEFSPDGKFILTGSTSDSRLWDVETGLLVSVFPKASVAPSVSAGEEKKIESKFSFGKRVHSYDISPDGLHVAVVFGGRKDGISIYSTVTGELEKSVPLNEYLLYVKFSHDGKRLLYARSDKITMIDLDDLHVIFSREGYYMKNAAFSQDGKFLALNFGSRVEVFRINEFNEGDSFLKEIAPIENYSIAIKPTHIPGRDLIAIYNAYFFENSMPQIFSSDLNPLEFNRKILDRNVSSPAFFDGGIYLSEYDEAENTSSLVRYDLDSLEITSLLTLGEGEGFLLASSSDGKKLACLNPSECSLFVLDMESGERNYVQGLSGYCNRINMSCDGRFLVYATEYANVIEDLSSGESYAVDISFERPFTEFSPDGKWFLSHDYGKSGVQIYSTEDFKPHLFLSDVIFACFSGDSRTMAVFTEERCFVFDFNQRKILRSFPIGQIDSAFFSGDGRNLFVSYLSGKIECFEVSSGRQLAVLDADDCGNYAVYTQEGYVKGNGGGIEKFIHLSDGTCVYRLGTLYGTLYRPDLVDRKLDGLRVHRTPDFFSPLMSTKENVLSVPSLWWSKFRRCFW